MSDFTVTELAQSIDWDALPYWDVVIVGAGPAGLAAALTTAHRGLTTLVIDAKEQAGGQPQFLYPDKRIVDIPGFPDGITGDELSARTYRQAVEALVQFRFGEELVDVEETEQVEKDDPLKRVVASGGSYAARKVILACGLLHFPRRLGVIDALASGNVHYRIPKVSDYEGRGVAVVGGGDSAFDAAVIALQRNGRTTLLVREQTPVAKQDSVARVRALGGTIRTGTEVVAAHQDGDRVHLSLSGGDTISVDFVIVQIGFLSARDTFERLDLRLNEDGSIAIDPYFETSRSGIFAVGDVHGDIKLITVAWAEGIQAAIYAFKEITSPYWLNEKRLRDQKIALIGDKISRAARGRRTTRPAARS
jgi:ferredoxin/flavodoxin---NADP+ reductase